MKNQEYAGKAAEAAARAKSNMIQKQGNISHLKRKNAELTEALRLHLKFLDSLPNGWLGKIVADIGALNDAYIASSKALKP